MPSSPDYRRPFGFTLVELLVSIALIAVLGALLIVVLSSVRQKAATVQCTSNLRQIGIAIFSYTSDHQGQLPPGYDWDEAIAEYLAVSIDDAGKPLSYTSILQCPLDPAPLGDAQRSYTVSRMTEDRNDPKGVFGARTLTDAEGNKSEQDSRFLSEIPFPDRTIMVAEKYWANNKQFGRAYSGTDGWMGVNSAPRLEDGAYYHGEGTNYLFCDGHVELLKAEQVIHPYFNTSNWRSGRWGIGPR